jgi:hypothetical protein
MLANMRQHGTSGINRSSLHRFWLSSLGLGLIGVGSICSLACGAPPTAAEPRYPEKKRPETLRSASDDKVMGAQDQNPSDMLEVVPTNEHPARGWTTEDGKLVPDRERQPGSAAGSSAAGSSAVGPTGAAPQAADEAAAPETEAENCTKGPNPQPKDPKKKVPCPPN